MPCIDSAGDVFVSMPLPGRNGLSDDSPSQWLVAIGDVAGKGEPASRLRDLLESELTRLAGIMTDPASILTALNHDLVDAAVSERFATLVLVVIDGDRHELIIANAGHVPPLLRHRDRRIDSVAEEIIGLPLWIVPTPDYENLTLPISPGDVVIFHSDGITAIIDNQICLFDLNRIRQAISQARDDAASIGQSILDAMLGFGQERAQCDDITLLCLGRLA
jgi:sigma-B regulation protein RsbU (phosphoserine phosphatase)